MKKNGKAKKEKTGWFNNDRSEKRKGAHHEPPQLSGTSLFRFFIGGAYFIHENRFGTSLFHPPIFSF